MATLGRQLAMIRSSRATAIREQEQQSELEGLCMDARLWKLVARNMERGIRDHHEGFNVYKEEVPASWKIQAMGRPGATEADVVKLEEEANEAQEDIVCSVCHTGYTELG